MQKATPIESLPNASGQQNASGLQMTMTPEPQVPQQQHQQHSPQNHAGMHQEMGMEREGQRLNDRENFVNRQFVPSSRGGPPLDMYDQPPPQVNDNFARQLPQPPQRAGGMIKEQSLWQQLMAQSKILLLVVALIFVSQLQTVQNIVRTFARMVKVPDTMVFTVSKLLISLIGAIVFFFALRNI